MAPSVSPTIAARRDQMFPILSDADIERMRRFFRPTLRRPLPRRLLPMPNSSKPSLSASCAEIVQKVDYMALIAAGNSVR